MNAQGQKPVATHQGLDIWLDPETGQFYCDVDKGRMASQSLVTLKKRLDDHARRAARAEVAGLELVVLTRGTGYYRSDDQDDRDTWTRGLYVGLNAHTAEIQLKVGQEVQRFSEGWFFRAEDAEAITTTKAVLATERAARKASKQAEKQTEKTLESVAVKLVIPRCWERKQELSKSELAAEAEEAFVAALTQKGAA